MKDLFDNSTLSINKKYWKDLSKSELEQFRDEIFNWYRVKGFPYFDTSKSFRDKEYKKLHNYDFKKTINKEDKVITQTMHGLSLAWSYMPHSWDIRCNKQKTPLEAFNDDEIFMKVIEKRLRFGDNISDNGIRKMLKIFTGVQSVSNFRPTASASIYSLFCNEGDTVWDMSCGFGGRLLGADLAKVKYIGTEPSTKTFNGLKEIIRDYNINATILNIGSEDFIPEDGTLDFCFTSPPYFDTEEYSNEDTQSYIKYPTKEEWINGFLKQTFENCYKGLKDGKFMVINIANVKSFKNIEEETQRVALEVGFTLDCTWKLALSKLGGKDFKYEPLFVFKK